MSEHAPTPEEPSLEFTYGNCRDEALHLLVASQWDEQTSGDPACDTGLFAHITNNIADADVLQAAWGKELAQIGTTVADITGHFIVIVDRNLHVTVQEYHSRDEAYRAYIERDEIYLIWRSQQRPHPS
jgi:hypothetical protein